MKDPEEHDITGLLSQVREGKEGAEDRLLDAIYPELYARAERAMQNQPADHTLQPTALVNEAYLRLIGPGRAPGIDRLHFFSVAASAMRCILVDHFRKKDRDKRLPASKRVPLEGMAAAFEERSVDLPRLDAALTQMTAFDSELSRVVELHFFGGLTMAEIANLLDRSQRTIERRWQSARAWLAVQVA